MVLYRDWACSYSILVPKRFADKSSVRKSRAGNPQVILNEVELVKNPENPEHRFGSIQDG